MISNLAVDYAVLVRGVKSAGQDRNLSADRPVAPTIREARRENSPLGDAVSGEKRIDGNRAEMSQPICLLTLMALGLEFSKTFLVFYSRFPAALYISL
jgi:hypothetical protein